MGFIGPIIKSCGCYWAIGNVPDKYLGYSVDANEYDHQTGRTIKIGYEDPGTTTEMNGWTYCEQHTQEMLKEIYDEEKNSNSLSDV